MAAGALGSAGWPRWRQRLLRSVGAGHEGRGPAPGAQALEAVRPAPASALSARRPGAAWSARPARRRARCARHAGQLFERASAAARRRSGRATGPGAYSAGSFTSWKPHARALELVDLPWPAPRGRIAAHVEHPAAGPLDHHVLPAARRQRRLQGLQRGHGRHRGAGGEGAGLEGRRRVAAARWPVRPVPVMPAALAAPGAARRCSRR